MSKFQQKYLWVTLLIATPASAAEPVILSAAQVAQVQAEYRRCEMDKSRTPWRIRETLGITQASDRCFDKFDQQYRQHANQGLEKLNGVYYMRLMAQESGKPELIATFKAMEQGYMAARDYVMKHLDEEPDPEIRAYIVKTALTDNDSEINKNCYQEMGRLSEIAFAKRAR
jgi:hypothetical protein